MRRTINFTGFVGIGIKKLSINEFSYYCISKNSYTLKKIDNQNENEFKNQNEKCLIMMDLNLYATDVKKISLKMCRKHQK